ncbi:Thiamine thiazole synthase, chloroplastic [Glycine soja]|uniref:Thiamine thiazole synthase, chloroplastic n=1 Tax=Glycine soja TaxID=3848 RepID=A0A0B2R2N5_GLYSO|nr:Thiamine thiazole synthase, chloroplastic [Glycine soja]
MIADSACSKSHRMVLPSDLWSISRVSWKIQVTQALVYDIGLSEERHGQAAGRRLLGLVRGQPLCDDGQLFSAMVVCKPLGTELLTKANFNCLELLLALKYNLFAAMRGLMFWAMMISKQKVAHLALKPLGRNNAIDGTCGVGTKEPQLIFASADSEEIVDD